MDLGKGGKGRELGEGGMSLGCGGAAGYPQGCVDEVSGGRGMWGKGEADGGGLHFAGKRATHSV